MQCFLSSLLCNNSTVKIFKIINSTEKLSDILWHPIIELQYMHNRTTKQLRKLGILTTHGSTLFALPKEFEPASLKAECSPVIQRMLLESFERFNSLAAI